MSISDEPSSSVDLLPAGPIVPGEPEPWGWTRSQRLILAALLFFGLIFLLVQYLRRPYVIDDPVVLHRGQRVELETQIDPNTADFPSLIRIPRMTEKLARAILDYRDAHRPEGSGLVVFQNMEDLAAVHVGRSTLSKKSLAQLRPFLTFPGDATQPAPLPYNLTSPKVLPDGAPAEDADLAPQ